MRSKLRARAAQGNQMDLLDDPIPGSNTPEFTVGEIAGAVKKLIEGELGWVRVRGEVGRVVLARSGHLYFDLKDDRNVLSCMTWKGQIPGIGVMPEEGMEVVAEGRMTASGFQSKFSLNVQQVAVAGEGALMALLEKRKKALAAEGLFDEARKKPLPYLPEIIGVVTSMQGAVIRDILHRLRDRFPRKVLVWPVAVQGQACAPEVARAIAGFNALTPGGPMPRPGLIIVARGGGSIEDLWGFNEEVVARAAAASDIPLISAVGHETDTTLIDFVSDQRAPTPTAAAEMAVPVRRELLAWLKEVDLRLERSLASAIERKKQRLQDMSRALPSADRLLEGPRQRLDRADQLGKALQSVIDRRRIDLAHQSGGLRPQILTRRLTGLRERLEGRAADLHLRLSRHVERGSDRLTHAVQRFRPDAFARELDRMARDLSRQHARLREGVSRSIANHKERLEAQDRLLATLGYEATLQRGYAVVRGDDTVVTSKSAARKAAKLEIQFADGRLVVHGKGKAPPRVTAKEEPDQGSLF